MPGEHPAQARGGHGVRGAPDASLNQWCVVAPYTTNSPRHGSKNRSPATVPRSSPSPRCAASRIGKTPSTIRAPHRVAFGNPAEHRQVLHIPKRRQRTNRRHPNVRIPIPHRPRNRFAWYCACCAAESPRLSRTMSPSACTAISGTITLRDPISATSTLSTRPPFLHRKCSTKPCDRSQHHYPVNLSAVRRPARIRQHPRQGSLSPVPSRASQCPLPSPSGGNAPSTSI